MSDSRFDAEPSVSNHFAWIRTRMSIERTLMAWVRTATSLIGFGFTIVQFFDRFGNMDGVEAARRSEMPRMLGLALIGAGVIALVVSAIQYHWISNYLSGPDFKQIARVSETGMRTPVLGISVVVTLIGIAAFGAVYLRML